MAYRIRKSFTFEAAHQLETAYTRECYECVHGHSYTVEMVLAADVLDERRMVLDFGELKPFKDSVMERWDHGLILHEDKRAHFAPLIKAGILKESKVSFLNVNPTAESMAAILYRQLGEFIHNNVSRERVALCRIRVVRVRVHETGTGWAESSMEGK